MLEKWREDETAISFPLNSFARVDIFYKISDNK